MIAENGVTDLRELLMNIDDVVTFRPEDGPLRAALVTEALTHADEGQVELFSASNCDIQVTVSGQSLEKGVIRFRVISDQGEQLLEAAFGRLNEQEKADFRGQLSTHAATQRPVVSGGSAKVIVRKAPSAGMYTQQQAADKLGCSGEVLKNRIPCTDYSYDEIGGKKVLREYYWSQSLIERLLQVKSNGAKPEDIKSVATECCFGDTSWAEELLASLQPKAEVPTDGARKKRSHRYPPRR